MSVCYENVLLKIVGKDCYGKRFKSSQSESDEAITEHDETRIIGFAPRIENQCPCIC